MSFKTFIKDVNALTGITATGALFVLRASRSEGALPRAGRNAVSAACLAAPIGGALGFALAKTSKEDSDHEAALEVTAGLGTASAVIGGLAAAIASLAYDSFRG